MFLKKRHNDIFPVLYSCRTVCVADGEKKNNKVNIKHTLASLLRILYSFHAFQLEIPF